MRDLMEYKGYIGKFTFNEEIELFQGKVSNINDLVTFQGKSMEKLLQSFQNAVNDYLSWCEKNGKDPQK